MRDDCPNHGEPTLFASAHLQTTDRRLPALMD